MKRKFTLVLSSLLLTTVIMAQEPVAVDIDRSNWTVTTQTDTDYDYVVDDQSGLPEHMFDGNGATFLSLAKPGKSYGNAPLQGSSFIPGFTVDLQSSQTFNYIKWAHRSTHAYNYLRIYGIDIYGSNTGAPTDWKKINEGDDIVWIPNVGGYVGTKVLTDATTYIVDIPTSTYRYVRVSFVMWSDVYASQHPDYEGDGAKDGATFQVAEFGLGIVSYTAKEITTSASSLTYDGLVNNRHTQSFTVSSKNLSEKITGTIEGPDANVFSFGEGGNSITKEGRFYIEYTPTEVGKTYEATAVLSIGDAKNVSVALKGTAFAESDIPLKISSIDNSNEHWYLIQFTRKATSNLVWGMNDSTKMVGQDTLKAGNTNYSQHWKIAGDWESGYIVINRATGAELLYNTRDFIEDDGEQRIITDDPYATANNYVLAPSGMYGNEFEFARFNTANRWQLNNRNVTRYGYSNYRYINDSGGKYLIHYTANDAGNELSFLPIDKAKILAPTADIILTAEEGNTITATYKVSGVANSTKDITISITGSGDGTFTVVPSVLPYTGGDVTVTYNAKEGVHKQFFATMKVTSPNADDIVINVSGLTTVPEPQISDEENDYWYYLAFVRRTSIWQGNGDEQLLSLVTTFKDDPNQQWKFVSAGEEGGYIIVNRAGGKFYYKWNAANTERTGDGYIGDEDMALNILKSEAGVQLEIKGATYSYRFPNEWYSSTATWRVTRYSANDAGNWLKFYPADVVNYTGIKKPEVTVDTNDTLIATKYYNLYGVEVKKPATTGIYIVKKLYASGKTKASKELIQVK